MSRLLIPTLVVTGHALGEQASALDAVLARKPLEQRWAVLACPRPFGLPTLAADRLRGVTLRMAPAGCACCVGTVTFRVALVQLLRDVRPDHLVVEVAPRNHANRTISALADADYVRGLRVVGVIDAHQSLAPSTLGEFVTSTA